MLKKALSKYVIILKRVLTTEVELINRFEDSEKLPCHYCDITDKITISVEKNGNQFVIKTDEKIAPKTALEYRNFNDKIVVLQNQFII